MTEPSRVETSCDFDTLRTTFQRQNFYANGLHWQFYVKGLALYYRTSSDGVTWSSPTKIYEVAYPLYSADFVSFHYHEIYVEFVTSSFGTGPGGLWYRKGIPQSNGEIFWLDNIQHIPESGDRYMPDPTIAVDTFELPWIGYYDAGDWYPHVTKSNLSNGTWATTPGFPFLLKDTAYMNSLIISLANGKMYDIYTIAWKATQSPGTPSVPIFGRLWDGGKWLGEEIVTETHIARTDFHMESAVSDGDHIYFAFLKDATWEIILMEWENGRWGAEQVITTGMEWSAPILSLDKTTKDLYLFWPENKRIYYMVRRNGVWDPRTLFAEVPDLDYGQLVVSEYVYDGIISVAWVEIAEVIDPWTKVYDLYYSYLSVPVAPPPPKGLLEVHAYA